MSFFEDLKNTKVTDTAFYLMFILALIAPGTAYSMIFYLEVFKELDSWKALLMVISISAPLFVITTATTYITNHKYFEGEDGLKILGFYSCLNVLSSPYVVLVIAIDQNWSFFLTSAAAFLTCMVGGAVLGGASRI